MDWISEFQEKFKDDEEITNLKKRRFYGHLQINFFDGSVVAVNKYQTIKPTSIRGEKEI